MQDAAFSHLAFETFVSIWIWFCCGSEIQLFLSYSFSYAFRVQYSGISCLSDLEHVSLVVFQQAKIIVDQ